MILMKNRQIKREKPSAEDVFLIYFLKLRYEKDYGNKGHLQYLCFVI